MFFLSLLSCRISSQRNPLPIDSDADVYTDLLGEPVSWIDVSLKDKYRLGQEVMNHTFSSGEGLGPTFNADSCVSCHQKPVAGGSAPRYRDFWLVKTERWNGTLIDAGTNHESPVRNFYAIGSSFHIPESKDTILYARRNAPSMFGVGLFAFIEDEIIIANADVNDEDGDGISGKVNFEHGRVGKFGYKSQAFTLESFNRGALFNQMGITSNPLFYSFLENPNGGVTAFLKPKRNSIWNIWGLLSPKTLLAQIAAPAEPIYDKDKASDPEISNKDLENLLIFSTYIAAPRPKKLSDYTSQERNGAEQFTVMGCSDCHIPRLKSTIGPIRAYSDLLLHDMGQEMDDGIEAGLATGREFRTQPLWGVNLHGPYLHDGRANTLQEAIEWHGGEGAVSRKKWNSATEDEKKALIAFLQTLGGEKIDQENFILPSSDTPEFGESGGPRRVLNLEEFQKFTRGRQLFDRNFLQKDGRNDFFNADSCRACHQDPIIGGAGGVDVNVLLVAKKKQSLDIYTQSQLLYRSSTPLKIPEHVLERDVIIEARQPISTLGAGYIDEILDASILQNADEYDEDGDGISGRPHILLDGQVGKFGWKAQIPKLHDFIADALFQEIGITVDHNVSSYTILDDKDGISDPEFSNDEFDELSFYLTELAPPPSKKIEGEFAKGLILFKDIGCSDCHLPVLQNIPLYSDLLLHDVASNENAFISQSSVLATEFRTPPLWGVSKTAPYMHDGTADTIGDAIDMHYKEARISKENFYLLSEEEQRSLLFFLENL